jgi:hypothetical protein
MLGDATLLSLQMKITQIKFQNPRSDAQVHIVGFRLSDVFALCLCNSPSGGRWWPPYGCLRNESIAASYQQVA